jgi:hypothetical protein
MYYTYFSFVKYIVYSMKMDREEERETLSIYIEDPAVFSKFREQFREWYGYVEDDTRPLNLGYITL